ncbi:hypothetical protein CRM22_000414 [Opisthorchis felineus]|uniref:F-box domain-containing protein n=1 Tax=Opisthorchis felineus TaxID=147828 RepID=A0A4S2MJU2_OPIFE|nr:hypothetical protein CRM22_000414 [Opisthorchis felineus]
MPGQKNSLELVHQYAFEVVDFSSQYGSESGTANTAGNLVGPCQVYPNYCDSSATCSFRTFGQWWRDCPSAIPPVNSRPDGYSSEDYVDLYFDVPVVPIRLQIFETYNPGAIVRILACYRTQPADGPVNARTLQWVTLWKAPEPVVHPSPSRSRLLRRLQLPYTVSNAADDGQALTLAPHRQTNWSSRVLPDSDIRDRICSSQPRRARVFQPPLSKISPYPIDLIRLELDGSRCSYFTELDAVCLTGWAEVPRWPGFSQLEGTDSHTTPAEPVHYSAPRTGSATASFFSELLRPRTPQLCFSPENHQLHYSPQQSSFSSPDLSPEFYRQSPLLPICSSLTSPIVNTTVALVPSCSSAPVNSSSLCHLPRVGMDLLLPRAGGHLVAVTPGAICPITLFGLMHLDETARWRHGPFTRLPYEILLRIFSYLDFRSICRAANVSRQFRCLADDALAQLTSLNLQAYWPGLNDSGLLSLGKRLGRVNLTARAAAAATTGNSVAPFNFLRRLAQEETESNHELHGRVKRGRQLAARIRSWSTSATTATSSGRIIQTDHANSQSELSGESCNAESPLCETFLVIPGEEQKQEKSNVLRPSTASFYDAYCEAFPPCRLRRLDMSWCGNYSAISPVAFGDFLGDACRQLTTLRLASCKFLNDDCLLYIVNTCPLLRELDLSSCTGITSHGFLALSRLIRLNWLSLYRTQIADDGLLSLAELCQHLCHINLGSCTNVQDMNQVLDNLTRNNTGLISINLWRCVTVSAVGVSYLARSCPLLEELDLGWCRNIALTQESNCIVHLVQHCCRIRKLHLTGTSLLNSEELTFVSQRLCSTLEQLDIHGSATVNSTAVAMVLSCCTRLRLLDISFCAELPLHSVTRLRRLFPLCTIITSIPDMYVDVLGARPVSADGHVFIEEMVDDVERHLLDQFLDAPFIPNALVGRPNMLALPAPIPLPALTGPTSD